MIDVIGIIAAQILQSSIRGNSKTDLQAPQSGLAAVLYMLALVSLYKFTKSGRH